MKILVIDNAIDLGFWGGSDFRRYARLIPEATWFVRRAPEADLPADPSDFDRIIVSGSRTSILDQAHWIDQLSGFLKRAIENSQPVLGVCYGHQLIARAYGGMESVGRSKTPEFGWTEIVQTEKNELFDGLPDRFYSFSSHFDEVQRLPSGFVPFAKSDRCGIQAYRLKDKPTYGIQFHPEKDLQSAERIFVEMDKHDKKPPLFHRKESRKLYRPEVAEVILRNFLRA